MCACIRHTSTGLRRDVPASKFKILTCLCIYIYYTMACCAICNARARQYVCDHKQFSFRFCCVLPFAPNQHIGGRSSAHRMCVRRDDLASLFAVDVPFETDFLRQYIRLCTRPHATDRPTTCCA